MTSNIDVVAKCLSADSDGNVGPARGPQLRPYAGQCGWFYGIGILSLAQVFALEFTTPSEIYGADDFLVIAF